MSHKKAALTSHRDKGAKKKAEAYAHSELKSAAFAQKGSKSGADGKLPSVNKAPYSARDGTNKGRCVTRNEHLALYDLHSSVDIMKDERLDDIEFFYKVLCSAKRHMPIKKLESFKNHEGDSLVISTHKFLRMYEQRYKRPPPRSTMTNNTRMAYANSICNYHLTKDGIVIPGAYYNSLTDPPLVSASVKQFQPKSALNGAQGSVTGTDDVSHQRPSPSRIFSDCPHPWCNGSLRTRNSTFYYCFSVVNSDSHLFANHWRHGDVSVISLDVSHSADCDDCMCLACALSLLHSLHPAQSAINGNNGSYTNTDDHEKEVLCTKPNCRLGVHYHRLSKAKPSSGAAQRLAEKTASKDSPKPVGELVKCVNELGVPISCICCAKLGDKFHLPRASGVKKCDPVDVAKAEDAEKEQGQQDALEEIEASDYDHLESGAAGGGAPVYCVVIEQATSPVVKKSVIESHSPKVVERISGSFLNIPTPMETAIVDAKITFLTLDSVVERDEVPGPISPTTTDEDAPSCASDSDDEGDLPPIVKLTLDDFLDEISIWENSSRSCLKPPIHDDTLIVKPDYVDHPESRLIMVNTIAPPYQTLSARVMLFLTHLVASTDLSPMIDVPRVDRRAVLTTSMTATVDNFFLRLIFPAKWTWKAVTYEDYDLMVRKFYNATVTRDVFPKLYDIGVSHFAFIPIGQYDATKQVYSYFLARIVTGMEEMLSPAEKEYYGAAHRVQTTMNTFLALSNVLVLYHYQLIKAIGAH